MNNTAVESVFDSLFKFSIGQEVRHKGDTKEHGSDMGLLVLHRVIIENMDDDGNRIFERSYYCRMIRFSGSGEVQQFREKELLSVVDYRQRRIDDEQERDQMRSEIKATQEEIFKAFGLTKGAHVYRIVDGEVDKSVEYRQLGWSSTNEGRQVSFTEVGGIKAGEREFNATSPDQFVVIQ